jgi:polyphosphate:AMP phosphotransferase
MPSEKYESHDKISKEEFKQACSELEQRLITLQRAIRETKIPVLIIFEGWKASGVGFAISRILAPMDPRGFKVRTFIAPNEQEALYPPMWRYWRDSPARGEIAVFDGSWYTGIIYSEEDAMDEDARDVKYERIRIVERQLADDGTIILKFWLQIDEEEQARRFKKLEKDLALAWKVTKEDWRHNRHYNRESRILEEMVTATDAPHAPWKIIPAFDRRTSSLDIMRSIVETFENAVSKSNVKKKIEPAFAPPKRAENPLDEVDQSLALTEEEYQAELSELHDELLRLEHRLYPHRIPVIIAYEGWDAAGKGGNIKRLLSGLDHRGFDVIPISAPEGEDKTHHYLWRFWRRLPKGGHITVFDRTWYGRVLVERVEKFATKEQWGRAYREINEFESELTSFGAVVVKFWIHISKDEQLRRFKDRENTPYKQWKITEEDWRNRKRWNEYYEAVSDMLALTSTPNAPWTIIEGNNKPYARIKALRTVTKAISNRLDEIEGKRNHKHK